MQFFKKNQKQIVIFFLFAVLLVGVRLTIGKLQETIDNSMEDSLRILRDGRIEVGFSEDGMLTVLSDGEGYH